MNKKEIMKLYHGWDKAHVDLISKYVDIFNKPWPVYGPRNLELIEYCIKNHISVDDLDTDSDIYKKYFPIDRLY